jgi:hypothetical protein
VGTIVALLICAAIALVVVLPVSTTHAAVRGVRRRYNRARGQAATALAVAESRGQTLTKEQVSFLEGHVRRHPNGSVATLRKGRTGR